LILLVDIGNTRVKWAPFTSGTLGPQAAALHGDWSPADWGRVLVDSGAERVVAACVGAPSARSALEAASRQVLGRGAEFVSATPAAAGVRNGYSNPAQLGVDRWLAVIGAFHRHPGGSCIVDAGTALTVDAVDDTGSHLGGYIVPGPRLMVDSLLARTSELAERRSRTHGVDRAAFPRNTRDAIEQGCLSALAALVAEARRRLTRPGAVVPALVLTGGAAPLLMSWFAPPVDHVPDLVLQGLARVVLAAADSG
jgi:type III pantothenate kinase